MIQKIKNLAIEFFGASGRKFLEEFRSSGHRKSVPTLHNLDETESFIGHVGDLFAGIVI
jgi:hypothetical protein